MSRRTVTTTTTSKTSQPKLPTMKTDLDDWETDPDFIKNIDEMEQRWGTSRTVGSINMNELIDEVRRDHQKMREKFDHSSQRDHSEGFGGKFGIQHDRKDPSAHDYNYHEQLSKHSSQEVSRKVISSKENLFEKDAGNVSEARRAFLEKTESMFNDSRPPNSYDREFIGKPMSKTSAKSTSPTFKESTSKRVITEEKKSSSSLSGKEFPKAFQSIQEKIEAFKKEFEDIENKVSKKSDLSKLIKKTTEIEKKSNVQYVTRSNDLYGDQSAKSASSRISSTSPLDGTKRDEFPKANIKSLSEKFETLCREEDDDFKRRTEAKRREFFDQIKTQVRETRKGLDDFQPIDDSDVNIYTQRTDRGAKSSSPYGSASGQYTNASPSSRPSSRLSESSQSSNKPKIYTKSESTKEEIMTKIVKENDKIIENETKRNVERQSSCHGSSDDEDPDQPTSIKFIDQQFRTSPLLKQQQQNRTESPVDEVKRRVPVIDPEIKGGGLMARTLFDYTAAEDDELSFDVDDLITNIEKVDPGWYKGTITKDGKRKVGLFPANHVKLLNEQANCT